MTTEGFKIREELLDLYMMNNNERTSDALNDCLSNHIDEDAPFIARIYQEMIDYRIFKEFDLIIEQTKINLARRR
jgi:hypothetical protein